MLIENNTLLKYYCSFLVQVSAKRVTEVANKPKVSLVVKGIGVAKILHGGRLLYKVQKICTIYALRILCDYIVPDQFTLIKHSCTL